MQVSLTGSNVKDVSLLSAVSAIGAGAPQAVEGFKTLRVEVWGAGAFAVKIQANGNGSGTYYDLQPMNLSTMALVTSITAAGVYDIDVSGFSNVQANVTSISGGSVNAAGKWVA